MVNNKRSECKFDIEQVEVVYNAFYVGEFCLKKKDGGWHNFPVSVFYQETPPVEGYSNYFALYIRYADVLITDGSSAVEGVISCVRADDGEIIYSAYRHDFCVSKDESVFIDGGRDYIKSSISPIIPFKIENGVFVEINEND